MQPQEVNLQHSASLSYPLQHVVAYGDISGVQILLDAGAKINTQDGEGKTALHFVNRSKHQVAEKITLLVQHGADVKVVDRLLQCALHDAVHVCNRVAITTFLAMTDKATRQEQHKTCDIFFETPFITACKLPSSKNAELIIRELLADGCDPDTQPPGLQEPGMGKLILCKAILFVSIRWGESAAEIKLPLSELQKFVCKDASKIPSAYVNHWDAFFRRFFYENDGMIFKTAACVNDFDIWFTETEKGTWPVLCQAYGPFKVSFRIPSQSPVMKFHQKRNRGYTAAHNIIYTASLQQAQSPGVVQLAFKRLKLLHGLCNPLVVCTSGKTVASMFADFVKTLGADWLVDNALATPQLYTTIMHRLPMVVHANLMLQQENQARNSVLLSQHTRVGFGSGLLLIGPDLLQMVLNKGMLRQVC